MQTPLRMMFGTVDIEYLRTLFELPPDDVLINDFSAALQRDLLMHGRLFVTRKFVLFYSR
jgi:hypothetical protein